MWNRDGSMHYDKKINSKIKEERRVSRNIEKDHSPFKIKKY